MPKFEKVTRFGEIFNSNFNDGTCCFNKSFTEIIFSRCGSNNEKADDFCQLYQSTRDKSGKWSLPVRLELFADDTTQNCGQPALSDDGKTLYFASDAAGGYGGKDIYISNRNPDGTFAPARNMGSNINTTADEMFPYMRSDGTFYFSSNRAGGMGSLDIYIAQKRGSKLDKPQNIQAPLNSGADDFGINFSEYKTQSLPDTLEARGFFSSARIGGKGGDDIYRFELRKVFTYALKGTILENTYSNPKDPKSEVTGTAGVSGAAIQLYVGENGKWVASDVDTSDAEGNFFFNIKKDKYYKLSVTKKDYFSKSETTNSKNISGQPGPVITVNKDVLLDKIFKNKFIEIPNIFYDLDKSTIRPDAAAVLDSLVMPVLTENPDLKFELGSHTDSQGDDKYNEKLSQRRADAVVQYLIGKGIDPNRLTAKGYGETQIINRCVNGVKCSDAEHQQNRRTTFRVINAE